MCNDHVVKSATMTISEAYQRPNTRSEKSDQLAQDKDTQTDASA